MHPPAIRGRSRFSMNRSASRTARPLAAPSAGFPMRNEAEAADGQGLERICATRPGSRKIFQLGLHSYLNDMLQMLRPRFGEDIARNYFYITRWWHETDTIWSTPPNFDY